MILHTLIRSRRLDNNISFSLILNRVSVLDGCLCIENILWQGMMQLFYLTEMDNSLFPNNYDESESSSWTIVRGVPMCMHKSTCIEISASKYRVLAT